MLPPSYLDQMPDAFVQLWQQVEEQILQDVARRIGKMDAVIPTANWQLWRYQQTEAVRNDVVKLLAKYTGKSETAIRKLLLQAATEAMEREDAIYYHYDMEPPPFEENAALNNLLDAGARQTCGTWQNLTATTANTVTGAFERTLDAAWLKVGTGAFDYKTAVKQAVDSLADDHAHGHLSQRPHRQHRGGRTACHPDWREPDDWQAAGGPHGRNGLRICGDDRPRRCPSFSCRMAGTALPSRWCGGLQGAGTTRILKPQPATAPAQAFAAGTADTSSLPASRSWATRPNGRRSSCGS